MKKIFCLLMVVAFLISPALRAQESPLDTQVEKAFKGRGEVYFSIKIPSKDYVLKLTRILSIAKVQDNIVTAYANKKEFTEFLKLGMDYTLLTAPGLLFDVKMTDKPDMKNIEAWDYYPTYPAYENLMTQFQAAHPTISRLVTIGTLPSGRKLLALKITSYPDSAMNKPKFLYSSSMHGDELTGYIMMLHLIDYLVTGYGTNARVTNLVNSIEIYINPLANPDGSYAGGNSTITGATRSNANFIDLNRNYPDPIGGQHPDQNAWQAETQAFIAFANNNHIAMSANFHTGDELVNYPWDNGPQLHADDNWWQYVSRQFADTIHVNSTSGFFTSQDNGITNGYAWYQVLGGRQDYMTYFMHGRECTVELTTGGAPSGTQLLSYWNNFYRSFLNYMTQSLNGVHGIVTDSVTGEPLSARVFINGHDLDSSHTYSYLPVGNYYRYLYTGTYHITFSSPGYITRTLWSTPVTNNAPTLRDVKLVKAPQGIAGIDEEAGVEIFPNPANGIVNLRFIQNFQLNSLLSIYGIHGELVTEMPVNGVGQGSVLQVDLQKQARGLYLFRFRSSKGEFSKKIMVN